MSTLGDLIVEHGPFTEGRGAEVIPIGLRMALLTSADLNALRGELIGLREIAAIYEPAADGSDR